MAKEKSTPSIEEVTSTPLMPSAPSAPSATMPTNSNVHFTPEQLELVQQLIKANSQAGNQRGAISMLTDVRDPRKIETVNVSRFDGKFVIGFKDVNNDPYYKNPKYSFMKMIPGRRSVDPEGEPHVILLLSNDGKSIKEKEVPLVTYLSNRIKGPFPVAHIEVKDLIEDHGILGRQGASGYASAVDDKGRTLPMVSVKAETKKIIRKIYVTLPGFDTPVEINEAFLA